METDHTTDLFRWLMPAILVAALFVSGFYRHRARRQTGTIPRRREGGLFLALRLAVAGAFLLAVLGHVAAPAGMSWASLPLPAPIRWLGAVLGLSGVVAVRWVLGSLGRNVSETILTKERHELVTTGPYRWVRHPLYTTGLVLMVSMGLMAASGLLLALALITLGFLLGLVIPLEERALLARFGDAYRAHMRRTGRLLPRFAAPR